MADLPQERGYMRADEFFRNAQPTTILEDVRREMAEERARTLIDPYALRQMQDWSYLNGKVVGAEGS